jgi:hypothetical protein
LDPILNGGHFRLAGWRTFSLDLILNWCYPRLARYIYICLASPTPRAISNSSFLPSYSPRESHDISTLTLLAHPRFWHTHVKVLPLFLALMLRHTQHCGFILSVFNPISFHNQIEKMFSTFNEIDNSGLRIIRGSKAIDSLVRLTLTK